MSANVRIKSGTNQLHGSVFGYYYNEAMKARPYFLPADRGEARRQAESVRRHARRADRPRQAVLLRQLPGHARQTAGATLRHRADGGDARRRLLGLADADLRPAHGQASTAPAARRLPATSFRASDSIRSCRSCSRICRCRTPDRLDRQLLRERRLHVRPPQGGREGELQPDEQARLLRPRRLARLQLQEPADVRRSGRSADQRHCGKGGNGARRHVHDHRQRARMWSRRVS